MNSPLSDVSRVAAIFVELMPEMIELEECGCSTLSIEAATVSSTTTGAFNYISINFFYVGFVCTSENGMLYDPLNMFFC